MIGVFIICAMVVIVELIIVDVEFKVIGGCHLSVIFGIPMSILLVPYLLLLLLLLFFHLFIRRAAIIILFILLLFLLIDGFLFRTNGIIPCIVAVVISVVLPWADSNIQ